MLRALHFPATCRHLSLCKSSSKAQYTTHHLLLSPPVLQLSFSNSVRLRTLFWLSRLSCGFHRYRWRQGALWRLLCLCCCYSHSCHCLLALNNDDVQFSPAPGSTAYQLRYETTCPFTPMPSVWLLKIGHYDWSIKLVSQSCIFSLGYISAFFILDVLDRKFCCFCSYCGKISLCVIFSLPVCLSLWSVWPHPSKQLHRE